MNPDRSCARAPDDIDDLRQENARLVKAVAARDAFLAVAAHELRNPMTPILGRVTLLKRSLLRHDLQKDDVVEKLQRIEDLVVLFIERATTLLDVSRADAEHRAIDVRPIDLARLADELVENFQPAATHAGASLQREAVDRQPVVVLGDAAALGQVLENLVTNAIKYGGGTPIRVSATVAAGMGRITVADEGPGIPHEHQARIFERYERAVVSHAAISGYGVGLWIARSLCEAMAGSLDVVSTPGQGSAFSVRLPLVDPKETH